MTTTVAAVNGMAGNVGTAVVGTYGSLVLGADGTWTYTLANGDADTDALSQGEAATDVFSYTVVDANGRALTPALFGGITDIGLEEVSGEKATVDSQQALGEGTREMTVRPEFDVTLAYNPASARR